MDWSNVTAEELVDALREVDWKAPRPIWEFLSKFSVPKNQNKWTSRLKCNVYYYRTNYLAILALAMMAALLRKPIALAGSALSLIALMSCNDPFTASLNDVIIKVVRRVHPHSASLLRSICSASSSSLVASTSRQRQSNVRVAGLQRPLFVLATSAAALYCWYRSRCWVSLLLAIAAGICLPLVHASLRSPNLKARLASAREEFRAVWRGYQADMHHDYTL